MINDKILAIVGLIGVAIYALYVGGAESYSLINTIVAAVAGFVTGASMENIKIHTRKKKEETVDGGEL